MEALRAYLQRRMRFRFDRHPELIRKITIRLTEQNAATSDSRRLCTMSAEAIPSGEVLVSHTARDLYQAIGGAIERLGSALHGMSSRQRTADRGYESIRNVSIGGLDNNDEYTGSSRTELSPEIVSEFQVVNNGLSAESGCASGVSINVITRSGTNVLHGDAYLQFYKDSPRHVSFNTVFEAHYIQINVNQVTSSS